MKTIEFYDHPVMFRKEETELNVTEDFIEYIFAKYCEEINWTPDLWAMYCDDEVDSERATIYEFKYGKGLTIWQPC
jgi:hypothetical protein